MTCLIAWVGIDGRGTSSCYLAADSRFSWGDNGTKVWDRGRKVFCSRKSPDIWGYYGEVLFPSTVIGQIVEAVEEDVLPMNENSQILFENAFKEQLDAFPRQYAKPFGVIHCRRIHRGVRSEFSINHISWSPKKEWTSNSLSLPEISGVVGAFGSGRDHFDKMKSKFERSDIGGTSRAVFQAFCKALEEGMGNYVGGAPQLVSLYREGPGQQHGIIWEGSAWIGGLRLGKGEFSSKIEFRDSLFQRCDPSTLGVLDEAQRQPHPSNLSSKTQKNS